MVATAVVGSAVIGAGASYASASSAAGAQKDAAAQANATQQGFFDQSQANLAPYLKTGKLATQKLNNLEGLNPNANPLTVMQSTLQSLPGYQFALQQGLKSTQNSAAARGLGTSGAAQKGAADYTTGLANQYYNNYLTGLQSSADTGANAAAGLANNATQTGANIGANTVGAGNAQAASTIAKGNSIGSAAASVPNGLIASSLLQGLNNQGGLYSNQNDDYLNADY